MESSLMKSGDSVSVRVKVDDEFSQLVGFYLPLWMKNMERKLLIFFPVVYCLQELRRSIDWFFTVVIHVPVSSRHVQCYLPSLKVFQNPRSHLQTLHPTLMLSLPLLRLLLTINTGGTMS